MLSVFYTKKYSIHSIYLYLDLFGYDILRRSKKGLPTHLSTIYKKARQASSDSRGR